MKYLKVLIWPIIFMIGQFLIEYIFVLYFNKKYYSDVDLYNVINTLKYQNKLNNFINSNTLLIIGIIALIFIPLLYLIYRKYRIKIKFKINYLFYFMIIGICIGCSYNLYLNMVTNYKISTLPIYIQIISSGIIGPIMEELLFRGIVYNKIKEFKSEKFAMILTTILFALMHSSFIDIIYALFMGYVLVYVYQKYKDIKYSMIIHISANISVILLSIIISLNIVWLNILLLIIFVSVLYVIIMKKYFN